jgi:hypothetical protein
MFSHKLNRAGWSYELCILLTGSLVHINGPFPAGQSDIVIFKKEGGLRDKLVEAGKKIIGDKGYNGHPDVVSTPNSADERPVRRFKSRALARHEKYNGRIKTFNCLKTVFRHSKDNHELCFRAVCVLIEYEVQNNPLFDVLIEYVTADEDLVDSNSDGSSSFTYKTEDDESSISSGYDDSDVELNLRELLL